MGGENTPRQRLSEMKCEKAGMEEYREQQETAAGALPGSASIHTRPQAR